MMIVSVSMVFVVSPCAHQYRFERISIPIRADIVIHKGLSSCPSPLVASSRTMLI